MTPDVQPNPALSLALALMRRWRTIIITAGTAMLVAVPIVLLQPKWYVTRTVLVPVTDQDNNRAQLLSQLPSGLASMVGTSGNGANMRLVSDIMKSASIRRAVRSRVLHQESGNERAIDQALRKGVSFEKSTDGTAVTVVVKARAGQTAADIANAYPPAINEIVNRLGEEAGSRRREYLATQVESARSALSAAEERLLAFQRQHNAPDMAHQAERTIDAAAQLQQQIAAQEIKVAQMRRTMTAENPELRTEVADLNAQREQLRRLTSGRGGSAEMFLSLRESPELKVEATRLMRDYTRNEQIYVGLSAALAEADLNATNDLPVLSVLDDAVVPTAPVSRSASIVMLAAILGIVAGILAALAGEYAERARAAGSNRDFFDAWDGFATRVNGRLRPRWGSKRATARV